MARKTERKLVSLQKADYEIVTDIVERMFEHGHWKRGQRHGPRHAIKMALELLHETLKGEVIPITRQQRDEMAYDELTRKAASTALAQVSVYAATAMLVGDVLEPRDEARTVIARGLDQQAVGRLAQNLTAAAMGKVADSMEAATPEPATAAAEIARQLRLESEEVAGHDLTRPYLKKVVG